MPIIHAEPLRHLVGDTFTAAGCPADEGERIGRYLVEANLTGHDSHGVVRVPRYLVWMKAGTLKPGQEVTIITDTEAMAVVDGNSGFGQTVGPQAVDIGVDKARAHGVAIVALRNSGHLGRIGDWAERALDSGLVSIHFVNVGGSLLVAPFGGVDRRMSTNPVTIGVPGRAPGDAPLLLDFATSVVAEGKVLVAAKGGKELPPGSLIDADGSLSTDPKVLYGDADPAVANYNKGGSGSIRAMGEHKGSGLSFMCEMLAGALTGSGCAGPDEQPVHNGMLSIYMVPETFDAGGEFAGWVGRYVDFYKSAAPAEAGGEVLVPGEPEARRRQARLADGIELPKDVWGSIATAAREQGLDEARIDASVEAA